MYKEGKKWWRARQPDGSEALIPIAHHTKYLGTYLSLQAEAHKVVGHRIEEANQRTGKIRKAVRSRQVFGLAHRVRIWQACAASSATFGLLAFAPSAKAVALLRGWFYRQLRAVADSPAHITHESNQHLRQRLGVQDPVDATVQPLRHKLEKLRVAEPSIINQQQTIQYWEGMLQQYLIFHTDNTEVEPSSRLLSVPAQQTQPVACTVCGVYFPSTKAMRQHRGRVHTVYVSSHRQDDETYQQQDHSTGGVPQCIHCGLKAGSWDSLRNHVLNNVCAWQQRPGPTRDAETQDETSSPRVHPVGKVGASEDSEALPPIDQSAKEPPASAAPEDPNIPLLRQTEVVRQLLQPGSKVQIVSTLAEGLTQNCGFCGQWIAKGGSVKEHIKRKHPHIWHTSIGNLEVECAGHKPHLVRDSECDFCKVTVYQPDRHARSCTVIFQVALATAWHKVGAPETAPTTRDVRTCITAEFLARQLDPATYQQDTRDADDNEVIDMLTRHCGLCLQTLTNQQDWRRHCAHQHQESWKQAGSFEELLRDLPLSRPCQHCGVTYHKTPKVHAQKCLPLLQIAFLSSHGRQGAARGGQHVGATQPNGAHHARTTDRRGDRRAEISSQRGQRPGQIQKGADGGPESHEPAAGQASTSTDQVRQPARDGPATAGSRQKLGTLDGLWSAGNYTPAGQNNGHLEGEPRAKQMQLQPKASPSGGTPARTAGTAGTNGGGQGSAGPTHSAEAAYRGANGVDVHTLESRQEDSGAQGGKRALSSGCKGGDSPPEERSPQAQCHTEIPCPGRSQEGQARDHDIRADGLLGCRRPAQHQQGAACPHGLRSHLAQRRTDQAGEKSQATAGGPTASHRCNEEAVTRSRQSIFTNSKTLSLERLPGGVLQSDLAKNTCPRKQKLDPSNPAKPGHLDNKIGRSRSIGEWLKGNGQPAQSSDASSPKHGKTDHQEKEDTAVTSTLPIRLCVLENPSNLCYLNSTVQALLHLFDQVKAADRAGFGSLRPMLNALKKCAKPQQLSRRNDCMKLLQGWHDLHQQHDAAELLQHLTKDGVPRILAGRWESRVSGIREHEPAIIRAWNTAVPLIPLPCSGYATTQLALDSWMTQPGPRNEAYVTALAAAPAILSVQLLRFQEKGGRIKKVRSPVTINPVIQVPTFTADHTQQLTMSEYRLISGIVHTGDTPNTGHYRCFFLKPQSHSSEVETIAEALEVGAATSALQLVDDGRTPVNTTARDVQHINRNWYILFFSRQ